MPPLIASSPESSVSVSDADLSKITVIIPVHNEEQSIPSVLRDLPPVGQVIVVDNASTDRSAALASELGADVVEEPQRGYGAACLAGIARIQQCTAASRPPPEIVVFLDGDYSDYPDELSSLVTPILQDNVDLVIGSRLLGQREKGAMPPQSLYGNKLACLLMRLFWGVRYTDLGPFRAITWPSLQSLKMQDRNFGWTVEMQVKAAAAGLAICEVPVSYRRRIGISKISGTVSGTLRAGYKILATIARYRWITLWSR